MLKEFKDFAVRGNVVDMAVGIIIGGAFGTIVKSLVDDVLMPPIGLLLGGVDFSDKMVVLKEAVVNSAGEPVAAAVQLKYGLFVNGVISFLIVAFAVFLLIKGINQLKRKPVEAPAEPTVKDCPFCCSAIPIEATRCPNCTSQIP
ncbi:MAG TPA: large-conductance mechanosensitive channel protein MscL [bacterium]|nr:large-conductance mechanosensitive channel protein MscL [bacterium]HPJ71335.1 large-conductance mechanosensitive channel protein MscL [bacterium]HPQ66751.1 large-conductance mechanosensitive channel protein MscL [bacterium]